MQQRAKETVDQIPDNAASLLQEVGVEEFNTNLIAERAGVAVRSVYRYYPNKLAVIVALADAIAAALRARGADERPSRIARIARTLLDTQDVAVDEALSRRGRVPVQLLDELKLMHRSYLAHFVS
jgi:AcrR family transcriptional regulator